MKPHLRALLFTVAVLTLYLGLGQLPLPVGEISDPYAGLSTVPNQLGMLGVTPFVSAALLVELALLIWPAWRARRDDAAFRLRSRRVVLGLALFFAGVQGFSIGVTLEAMVGPQVSVPGVVMMLVLGAGLSFGAAELIARYGLGSGFLVLFFLHSLQPLLGWLVDLPAWVRDGYVTPVQILAMAAVCVGVVLGTEAFFRRASELGPGLPFRLPSSGIWPWALAGAASTLPPLIGVQLSDTQSVIAMVLIVVVWTPVASLIWHWSQRRVIWSEHKTDWVRAQVLSGALLLGLVVLDTLITWRWASLGWPGLMPLVLLSSLGVALYREFQARSAGLVLLEEAWDVRATRLARARLGPVTAVGLHYRTLTRIFGVLIPIRLFGEPPPGED